MTSVAWRGQVKIFGEGGAGRRGTNYSVKSKNNNNNKRKEKEKK